MSNPTLTIGIVAGEVSGDALGGDFMQQMNQLHPNIRWVGVGGQQMAAQGLNSLIEMNRLSVMGLIEVIKHLPNLVRAKKQILSAFFDEKIDIFVGIDAPDFNLRLGKSLKKHGIFCVQYVSPSIWAWRENRINSIKQATDLVLCLFPFELAVYQKHQHPAVCVGHPLLNKLHADTRPMPVRLHEFIQQTTAFGTAALKQASHRICLMAGSRNGEIHAILPLLLDSAKKIHDTLPDSQFILPVITPTQADLIRQIAQNTHPELLASLHILHNNNQKPSDLSLSHACMNVSDVVVLASGTATLECLLLNRPMVVVYKMNKLSFAIAQRLVKIPYVALPNILAHGQTGKAIVPELIQHHATAETVSAEVFGILNNQQAQIQLLQQTTETLRADSHHGAAQSVLQSYFQNKL